MVGDGANDAAALAAADVGIAVRGGAEVSLRAAPVFIASGELSSLGALFVAAVRATRLIYCAMAISLAYNCVAVALAMSGHISPLVAAILMPISSISVFIAMPGLANLPIHLRTRSKFPKTMLVNRSIACSRKGDDLMNVLFVALPVANCLRAAWIDCLYLLYSKRPIR